MIRPEKGGNMGPYCEENLAAACTMCNMLKSYRTITGFVQCCRHIASKQTEGENFGEYPERFKDNISKRSRSSYITASSTHHKTHAITNAQYNEITAKPCYYCHKEPREKGTFGPTDRGHFNGLDRLDSTNRVYTIDLAVSCCGTCNTMKGRWPLDGFIEHCRKVARFHVGKDLPADADEIGGEQIELQETGEEGADKNAEGTPDDEVEKDGEAP